MPQIFPDVQWTTTNIVGAGDSSTPPYWVTTANLDNTIGNGVAFLRTRRSAGFVVSNLILQPGSTTTFGTGAAVSWSFKLPTNIYAGYPSGITLFQGEYLTAAAAWGYSLNSAASGTAIVQTAQFGESQTATALIGGVFLNGVNVTNTAPWTWAANYTLIISWAAEAYGI